MPRNKNSHIEICPFCRSENVLPFEDDTKDQSDLPVIVIILTALSVLALYFAFVVTSYMYFPLVVFIAIILTTRVVNRQERSQRKKIVAVNKEFICLSCNKSFSRSD
ncbi:MAG: hypothetical protein ABFR36_03120 [Acidobacteriota bacterium]